MGLFRNLLPRRLQTILGKPGGKVGGDTRTVAKNVLALATSGLMVTALSAATDLLIARHLGVDQFGQFATAVAFPWLFVAFSDMGMSLNTVRAGSRDPSAVARHLGNNLVVRGVMSVVLYLGMNVLARLLGYSEETQRLILVTGAAALLMDFFPTFSAVFEVQQQMVLPGLFRTLAFGAIAVLSVAGIIAGREVTYFAYANLVGTAAVFLAWWQVTTRRVKPEVKVDEIVPMLRTSFAFAINGVLNHTYLRIPTVVLSLLRPQAEVGLFAAAFRLFEIAVKTALTVHTAALPAMYRHSVQNRERFASFYRQMQLGLAAAAVLASLAMLLLAGPVVTLLYGAEFSLAIPALQIIAFATLFRYVSVPPAVVLIAGDKVHWLVANQGLVVVASVALSFGLIPLIGYLGAAISTAIREVLFFALNTLLAGRVLAGIDGAVQPEPGKSDGLAAPVPVESRPGPSLPRGKTWE